METDEDRKKTQRYSLCSENNSAISVFRYIFFRSIFYLGIGLILFDQLKFFFLFIVCAPQKPNYTKILGIRYQ